MIRASIVPLVIAITLAPAAADTLECKDVVRGDQNACTQQVKATCTSSDYWKRRACENDVAVAADGCRNGTYEAACKAAFAAEQPCSYYFSSDMTLAQMFGEKFTDSYNRVDAAAVEVARFDKEWSACYRVGSGSYSASQAEECGKAPGYYKTTFAREADHALGTTYDDLSVLIAANARLRPELRYRDAEIKAKLAHDQQATRDAEKAATAKAAAEEAAIRAVYVKAGIKGKRLELFMSQGMPSDGRFMATGCGRFVTTVKEMKAAKKLFIWLEGDGEVTLWKYTFSGDSYVKDEKTFDRKGDAYRFCK